LGLIKGFKTGGPFIPKLGVWEFLNSLIPWEPGMVKHFQGD